MEFGEHLLGEQAQARLGLLDGHTAVAPQHQHLERADQLLALLELREDLLGRAPGLDADVGVEDWLDAQLPE